MASDKKWCSYDLTVTNCVNLCDPSNNPIPQTIDHIIPKVGRATLRLGDLTYKCFFFTYLNDGPFHSQPYGTMLILAIQLASVWSDRSRVWDVQLNFLHFGLKPSCLQATIASLTSQESLHTVPHCFWKHTSTRPSKLLLPPTNLISVLLQAVVVWQMFDMNV